MSMNLSCSIVIPTHNGSDELKKTLDSILEQTILPDQIVIVDDASDTRHARKLEVLAQMDSRIELIRIAENVGSAMARNIGVESARGEWVAFNDDDCIWDPLKLEKQFDMIKTRGVRVGTFCHIKLLEINGEERIVGGYADRREQRWRMWVQHGPPGPPAFLVNKKLFERIGGFDSRLSRFEDRDLFVRLEKVFGPFIELPEALVVTTNKEQGVSRNLERLKDAAETLYRKYSAEEVLNEQEFDWLVWGLFHDLMTAGASWAGWRMLRRAIWRRPGDLRNWVSAVTSLGGYRTYRAFIQGWARYKHEGFLPPIQKAGGK